MINIMYKNLISYSKKKIMLGGGGGGEKVDSITYLDYVTMPLPYASACVGPF